MSDRVRIHFGEALAVLRTLESESVHCVVTSPPYWQLRDYGHPEQLGMEPTPDAFVERLCDIFDEVHRVLRSDGTCWVNLADTYIAGKSGGIGASTLTSQRNHKACMKVRSAMKDANVHRQVEGLQPKSFCAIPARFQIEMLRRGWIGRVEIAWEKPNGMPEPCRDRPTRSHEQLFLFSKSGSYWYDQDAIRTPLRPKTFTAHGTPARMPKDSDRRNRASNVARSNPRRVAKVDAAGNLVGANARSVWRDAIQEEIERLQHVIEHGDEEGSVWRIAQEPWKGEHTSTFPRAIARKCIVAGCPIDGVVLDPFLGTATTIAEALATGRRGVGIELNENLAAEQERRLSGVQLGIGEAAHG